ncbi:MAG: hypothetical protein GEU95_08700 [Rhizobiales bacterium]|nr:hypothetical protein [Hyphomicrobiales bacterium]
MKIPCALVTAAMLATATPAHAQQLDLSTITCKEFLEMSKENVGLILMWMAVFPHLIEVDDWRRILVGVIAGRQAQRLLHEESDRRPDHGGGRDDCGIVQVQDTTSAHSRASGNPEPFVSGSPLELARRLDRGRGRADDSASFSRPRERQRADQEHQPDCAGEDRQHANPAHHAGLAHAQADPVVATISVTRPDRDDARYVDGA